MRRRDVHRLARADKLAHCQPMCRQWDWEDGEIAADQAYNWTSGQSALGGGDSPAEGRSSAPAMQPLAITQAWAALVEPDFG
jgi:hypothetical protein